MVISGDNGGMPNAAGNQCPSTESADCLRGPAIKSCPFTGPAMCQNKKKNHKCTKVNEKASKAEAKATKKALAKDAAIKSCPFTGPAMCQNKKKNHKCTKVNEKKGPWMANDFVTCSWKKPKAAAADSGLAWAGFGGFGAFKETKFEMPAFKMPAMPKW